MDNILTGSAVRHDVSLERLPLSLDELAEHWTVLDYKKNLIAGKRGPMRLGFALLLKFYTRHGRFPAGRSEFPDEIVAFVAKQVKVPAPDLGFYDWAGSTVEYHRNQIRDHLGFRVCSVTDADKLTGPATLGVVTLTPVTTGGPCPARHDARALSSALCSDLM